MSQKRYVLVPVKPEIGMVEAGYEASLGMPDRSRHAMVIEMYEAMLAAREQGESEAECSPAPAEGLGGREYMDEIMCDVPGLAAAIWEEREREEFEAWFSDEWQHPKAVERDAVGYKLAAAQNAWTAWQAGWRAALAASTGQEVKP